MNKADFTFVRVENESSYCDYWFKVTGDTKEELTEKYMEQSMIEVSEVVFSIQDGMYGVKRIFPFNYDVLGPIDDELCEILTSLAFEEHKKRVKD